MNTGVVPHTICSRERTKSRERSPGTILEKPIRPAESAINLKFQNVYVCDLGPVLPETFANGNKAEGDNPGFN
ncbi:hypothetical protein NECAME_03424 [Necator americanus]|uniref:Uncharacterized protein n=1 Tax=Necator americanus TaxID=51031 RepID=W2T3L6_NECAM|nr:hypothetical protein NECAME_03424 [Necator americanus]ETN76493.1 hypothetical protein NECAME_03424 [Necator americanus]